MTIVHEDRNGCALHGGVRLLGAIGGLVPIVHANAGCSLGATLADGTPSGSGGPRYTGPLETSSTTLVERHVVFGGGSRLREQIKNTVKVLAGDAYVVLTGCVPEVIGDDVPAMVKEARQQHFPVLSVATPGFNGNAYRGYETLLNTLVDQLPPLLDEAAAAADAAPDATAEAINLLGIAPGQDAFWEGDLLELEGWIGRLGVPVRRLVGVGQTSADWRVLPRARLNVVLSPWGREAARRLHSRHGTPFVDFGWLPVGSRDLALLIGQIGQSLGVAAEGIAAVTQALDVRERHFLQKFAASYLHHGLQQRVAIVGGTAYAIGLARYLAGTLGQTLAAVIVTDVPDESRRPDITAALGGGAEAVLFSDSSDEIAAALTAAAPQVIFGSVIEAGAARALDAPLVITAAPTGHSPVLVRSYAGIAGALALAEDFSAAVIRHQAAADEHAAGTAWPLSRRAA
ncbi:nitrogenase component 1 [uncultured Thiodictyon sp.]|uniref:nitrogenase component 1 n=1 Tax=uncultured Thiodictyon sp. TaxID=1846217 RepID=UPI0025D14AD9|nr:nitrogenase component 1 [uncultured Thiodictyon sp.]